MARSGDRRLRSGVTTLAVVAVAAVTLSGCVSTQTRAARVQINSARIRASQTPTRVTSPGAAVRVQAVAVVAAKHRTRFVVTVHNTRAHAVSDLPISVGYRTAGGHRVYLNAGASADYFAAHLAAIGGHDTLSWVSDATRHLPRGAHPFALVGSRPSVAVDDSGTLPVIAAAAHQRTSGSVRVRLHNTSDVPQYQLPVYAIVDRHGHAIAAAQTNVAELSGGATRVLRLRLLGPAHPAGNSTAVLEAPPTIVQ